MAFSKATLIQRIRWRLNDNPYALTISAGLTAGYTSVTVPDGTMWVEGDIGEFVDGDQFYVTSVASNTLTVKPSWNGATSTNHSNGDLCWKNPVFSYNQIVEAIRACLYELWPYVYIASSATVTTTATTKWHNVGDASARALIDVGQIVGSSSDDFKLYGVKDGLPVIFQTGMPAAIVAQGVGLRFPSGKYHPTNSLAVRYAEPVTDALSGSNYTDFSEGVQADTVVYGACARLLGDREASRVTQEDVSMGDATVQPGLKVQTSLWFDKQFRDCRSLWHEELRRLTPLAESFKR